MLLNLVICDLVIACYGIPVDTAAAAMRGWRLPRPLCTTTGFLLNMAGMCSIFTLTGLSYQRYVVMTKPNWINIEGMGSTVFILVCVWTATAAMAVPPLAGFGIYVPEVAGIR